MGFFQFCINVPHDLRALGVFLLAPHTTIEKNADLSLFLLHPPGFVLKPQDFAVVGSA